MIQFWISEIARTRLSSNTRGSSSYRTRASGGYIIRIRPMAMGMLVLPHERLSMAFGRPSNVDPSPTPSAMARQIHKVRERSRNDRRSRLCWEVIGVPASADDAIAGGIDDLLAVLLGEGAALVRRDQIEHRFGRTAQP